jgi:FG-GAP repeat protein/VCBS repeat protein
MVSRCLIAVLVAGCYAPSPPNGALLCGGHQECPEGYHCAVDNTCWRTGEDPDPFTQPALAISPRNGAGTGSVLAAASRRPLFRWRAVAQATSYELQVDDSCDPAAFRSCEFPSPEAAETATGLSLRLSAGLPVSSTPPAGRRYYWRVRACGDGRCTPWSEVRYLDVSRNATDFTGDGHSDLVIGNAGASVNGLSNAGSVYVALGVRPGNTPGLKTLLPVDAADSNFYGTAVASAGDVDGDGFADLAVSAQMVDQAGRVYLYRGAMDWPAGTPSQVLGNPENQTIAFLGSALVGGDLDGDGRSDLVVAAERQDDPATSEGRVFIYAGQALPTGLITTPRWVLSNPAHQAEGHFGASLALGDFDGNGYTDLAVAADGQDLVGRVFLYASGPDGVSSSPSATLDAPQAVTGAGFGRPLATGDFDGDGYADLAVGAAKEDVGGLNAVGRVYLYHGGPGGIAGGSAPWRVLDNPTGQMSTFYGIHLAAGDFNGDGIDDLAVSSPYHDSAKGRVYIYHGASDGLPSSPSTILSDPDPANNNDFFGQILATGDRLVADGVTDLFVGAIRDNGVIYLFNGAASGLPATTTSVIDGATVAGNHLGPTSLSSAPP